MATKKISELDPATALTGTELVEVVQDGANVQTTMTAIADFASSGGTGIKYRFGFSIENTAPLASEVLLRHVAQTGVTFADDFAGSVGRLRPSGPNPATSQAFSILHNGSAVGTMTISTGGAVTFATTGGALAIAAGDEIRVEAPAAPDAALVGVSVTFYGVET